MFNFFNLQSVQTLIETPVLLILINIFFIIATFTDIKWMKIFDKFNIVMLIVRIVTFFIYGFEFQYLIGGFLMFATLLIGAMLTNAKIGGDIKFSGNIGLWLGFMPSILVLIFAIITNLIFRKITKNVKAIALAPFLYLGFIITCIITFFML